jgi:hypothetical protein
VNWWNGLDRQQRVGWTLILGALAYILYFCKVRLFSPGPPIDNKEWMYFVGTLAAVMLGTVNVRMAEARHRNQKVLPLIDPGQIREPRPLSKSAQSLKPKQMRKK